MGTSYTAIEDPKNKIQRTLLRNLQSYQPKESKPLMWNEVLADVLVNKIRIFSFKKQNKENDTLKENLLTPEKSALTNFISQVFFVYKKFVYDVFVESPKTAPNDKNSIEAVHLNPDIEERKADSDEMYEENGVTFSNGPKGEVELVEPRYHGKQVLGNETEESIEQGVKVCPEGTVNVEGTCINNSRLIMAVPSQCPIGYRRDRLGYCRMMF